ncbi:MAG: hypothetical protein WCK74_09410 [Gemmatimonadaceae bacterium]
MFRRSLRSRLASALLAPWFAFVVADPVPMHGCPMHEAVPAAASVAPAVDGAMAHHGHHAMSVDGAGTQPDSAPSDHGQGHSCTCLGACCVATPAPLPASTVSMETAPVGHARRSVAAMPRTLAVVLPDAYMRPFANGPPVTATA